MLAALTFIFTVLVIAVNLFFPFKVSVANLCFSYKS